MKCKKQGIPKPWCRRSWRVRAWVPGAIKAEWDRVKGLQRASQAREHDSMGPSPTRGLGCLTGNITALPAFGGCISDKHKSKPSKSNKEAIINPQGNPKVLQGRKCSHRTYGGSIGHNVYIHSILQKQYWLTKNCDIAVLGGQGRGRQVPTWTKPSWSLRERQR